MRLLDLFCGAGGAAMGYYRAGFDEIVGVDIEPQPNYPFTFIQGDATRPPVNLGAFDLIHASPPCQAHSVATNGSQREHLDLIPQTRALLSGYEHVIENVPGAPIRRDVVLCGSMFGLAIADFELRRHRHFELSEGFGVVLTPPCFHNKPVASVVGRLATKTTRTHAPTNPHNGMRASFDDAKALMEVPWMSNRNQGHEMSEAIPPAYTEYLGRHFLEQLARA